MRYLKILGLAAFAAMAFTAFVGASTASATTLEVTGVTKNESLNITASIQTPNTATLRDTFGFFANTCNKSHVKGKTQGPYTGTKVTGPLEELKFEGCAHTVTVHNPGKLYIEWEAGGNGTAGKVYSEEAEVTTYSTIHGTHVKCTTGAGTLIGTLTGVATGEASMSINATLTCGPHLHSAKWTGVYTITSPHGLGVSP